MPTCSPNLILAHSAYSANGQPHLVVKNISIGAVGMGSITGQVELNKVSNAVTFLRSCTVLVPSRKDGSRYSYNDVVKTIDIASLFSVV